MASTTDHNAIDIRAMLDELFSIRMSLASLSQERDAAILRCLPPDLQETVASIMQEFADMQEQREQEEKTRSDHIRTAAKALGRPVQGTHLQTTYQPGHRTWDSDRLLQLAIREPEIETCLRQGDPIVKILVRTHRRKTSPLLYDTHGI